MAKITQSEGSEVGMARKIMQRKTKATILLEEEIFQGVKRLVGKGGYRSLNACVNEALRRFLASERQACLEKETEEASRDKMFLADIKATMENFKYVDADTGRRLK